MASSNEPSSLELERFREYLRLLARLQIDPRLQGKIDPSDIVQQTLLKAHAKQEQFHGDNDRQLAGWLRRILANTLTDAARKYQREFAMQHSLEQAVDESSARLESWLGADQESPSENAARNEQLLQLAEALAQLPDDQRQTVELHHLRDMSVPEIAQHMDRTEPAVAGLLRRGLKNLRKALGQ